MSTTTSEPEDGTTAGVSDDDPAGPVATDGDTELLAGVGALIEQPDSTPSNGAGSEVPIRVCRKCSTQSRTSGEFCPHCGARFSRRGIGRRGKVVIGVVIVLLLAGGGATAMVLKTNHDNQVKVEKRHKAEQAQQAAQAAQAAQQAQQAQQAALQAENSIKVDERKALVKALQDSVTADAQKDINDGVLSAPNIMNTVCTPVGGGNLQDTLADHTGNWSCLAINMQSSDGTSSGYGFTATINYDSGAYTWRLGH